MSGIYITKGLRFNSVQNFQALYIPNSLHNKVLNSKNFTSMNFTNMNSTKGSFTNYVDKNLAIFDHLPLRWHFLWYERWQKIPFWTTYLLRLVNVPCERPLIQKAWKFKPWFGHLRWLSRCWWCQAKRPRPLRPRDAKWLQCAGFWSNSDSSTRKRVAVAF